MVQTVYTSARDVDVRKCKPQPLLRLNYFSEFRTEVEKAKARKALGITDSNDLLWGNILGFLELQKDLVKYIQDSFNYSVENYSDIKSIQEALNYLFEVVSDYSSHKEDFIVVLDKVTSCQSDIEKLQEILNSYSELINILLNNSTKLDTELKQLLEISQQHSDSLQKIEESLDGSLLYTTDLDDSLTVAITVGGIQKGTKVSELEGKSYNDILDQLLFPTIVRDLIKPTLSYSPREQLIEANTSGIKPALSFIKNDAGLEIDRKETITFNGVSYDYINVYTLVGSYKYLGTVNYSDGEKLKDNKGQETDIYIKAGSLTATATVNVTYPWFINSTKQKLVPFNKVSGDIEFTIGDAPSIKLPGVNSKINSFMVNGGSGFLEVNLEGAWTKTIEKIGDVTYQVWTKEEAYIDSLPHIINFTLLE